MRTAAVAALAAAPLALAACSGDDGDGVTLRYAFWDDNQRPAVEAIVEAFEESNPDIDIELEQNDWDAYWTSLDTQFAGLNAPDVFWNHVSKFPTFAESEVLLPLTDRIEEDGLDTSIYPAELYDSWAFDGEQYGLPKDWDSIALVYRLDALEAAGIDPAEIDDLEWNPDDGGTYVEFLQKLTIDENGNNALSDDFDPDNVAQYGTAMSSGTGQTDWWNYAVQNGCEIQSEPFGPYLIDAPECVEAVQFTADLYNRWGVTVPATSTNQPAGGLANEFVSSGQAATATDGSWTLSAYREGLEEGTWAVGPLPGARRRRHRDQRPVQCDLRWQRAPGRSMGVREVPRVRGGPADRRRHGLGLAWHLLAQPELHRLLGRGGRGRLRLPDRGRGPQHRLPSSLNDSVYSQVALEEFNQVWLGEKDAASATEEVVAEANAE
ncbi:hypothetical protein GCM10029992_27240 [Glycomyces albus]